MPLRLRLRHPAGRGVVLGLFCALLVWLVFRSSGLLHGVEDWMLDGCFFYRGERPTQARVVLIGIDGATLAELNKPLSFLSPELATVVRHVHKQGPSAIGLDLLIPNTLRDRPEFRRGSEGDPNPLGQAIADAGNVVLAEWSDGERLHQPLVQWRLKAVNDPDDRDFGFINLTADDDQILRRQRLLLRGEQPVPSFALALYARSQGAAFRWEDDTGTLRVGDEVIPLDEKQRLRINFAGPPGRFETLSFRDVLKDARDGQRLPQLKGAVVLIGVTARGQQDLHATPYANHYANYLSSTTPGLMSGLEVHAHTVAALHDRAFIGTPLWLSTLPVLLVVGAVLGHALARLNLAWGFVVAVAHHFAWKVVAVAAFTLKGWRIEVVAMLALGFVLYAATFALRWRTLRRMLGAVKSEAIARSLEADPHRLDPGGEEREVTVLFADIRSFTDFSEKHSPQQVVAMLNAYFDAVVPAIEAAGGVIDKYMGDGIMVLFGVPASYPDHALRALRAAVTMVKAVHARKELWRKLDVKGVWGERGLRIGVGVHTGRVVVGAIGSKRRLDYTAIGDAVNAAARIESENKPQETEVLISAATHAEIPPRLAAELGCVKEPRAVHVKGKKDQLHLYPVTVV